MMDVKRSRTTINRSEILIIDDDEELLIKLESMLEDQGYSTSTTSDTRGALKLLRSRNFDLVLLDDYLEGAGWESILDGLRPMLRNAPLIVLDATPDLSSEGRTPRAGVMGVVCKWNLNEVLKMVRLVSQSVICSGLAQQVNAAIHESE